MNIITITLNPAVDVHLCADALTPCSYNKVRFVRRDSGGKGVNLSRALASYGIDSLCYTVLGRETAQSFLEPLGALGMNTVYTLTDGAVRENINIQHIGEETVIAVDGPAVGKREIDDMMAKICHFVTPDTVVCFCGSLSEKTDKDAVLSALYRIKSLGARLVLDSSSLTPEEIIALRPFLIKPNEREAELLTGICPGDKENAAHVASALRDMGCENVMLTLGEDGAVLACADGVYLAPAPRVRAISTVGAGDSSIAGFLSVAMRGGSSLERLKSAVAFGTAACLAEGSLPPDPCQINRLLSEISVDKIKL